MSEAIFALTREILPILPVQGNVVEFNKRLQQSMPGLESLDASDLPRPVSAAFSEGVGFELVDFNSEDLLQSFKA